MKQIDVVVKSKGKIQFYVHKSVPDRLAEISEEDIATTADVVKPTALLFFIDEALASQAKIIQDKISQGIICKVELSNIRKPASRQYTIELAESFNDRSTGRVDGLQLLVQLSLEDYDALYIQELIKFIDF